MLLRSTPEQASALLADAGAPALGLHRATVHAVLADQLGSAELRLGSPVSSVAADQAVVTLGSGEELHGSVVVGADGLRSALRQALFGASAPRYSGYYCWRGVTGASPFPGDWAGEHWGAGRRFGGCAIDGGRLYWFLVASGPPGGTDSDTAAAVSQAAAGFPAEVRQAVRDTPAAAIRRDDISDRPPTTRWGSARVTLIGDAAHPMTPNLGQGACQAIEDAVVLTELIGRHGPGPAALRRYEALRQPRANAVVEIAYRIGRVAQWSGPARCRLRDTLVGLTPPSVLVRQLRSSWQPTQTAG